MGDERRVHVRIATTLPCVVQGKDAVHAATLLDLSRGGARLETAIDLAQESEMIVVGLALPDETIAVQANADVVRREVTGEGYRYGLRFASMDSDARTRLNKYISGLSGTYGGQ